MRYLLKGVLPIDWLKKKKLKKYATKFKVVDRKLFKRSFQGNGCYSFPTRR